MLASTCGPHFERSFSLETLIPGTVTLRFGRLQHMNGGTEQINDKKPQEERPGPQEGAGGVGWLPFLVQRLCPVLWREGDGCPWWVG